MYTLLSGLYKHLNQRDEYSVLVLGLDNAGKTTLLEQIKTLFAGTPPRPPHTIAPTVGLNVGKLPYGNERLSIWDLGGQVDLHGIWEKYYQECHGVIFLVDAADHDRLQVAIATFTKAMMDPQLATVPVVILANKQDMPGALRIDEILTLFKPHSAQLGDRDCRIQPLVALTGCAAPPSPTPLLLLFFSDRSQPTDRPAPLSEGAPQALKWLVNAMRLNTVHRRPRVN